MAPAERGDRDAATAPGPPPARLSPGPGGAGQLAGHLLAPEVAVDGVGDHAVARHAGGERLGHRAGRLEPIGGPLGHHVLHQQHQPRRGLGAAFLDGGRLLLLVRSLFPARPLLQERVARHDVARQPQRARPRDISGGLADLRADTAQGRGRGLTTAAVTPTVPVGVVLAGIGDDGRDATRALEDLVTGQTVRAALAEAGWDGDPLPTTGLPDPDVVYAILEELS